MEQAPTDQVSFQCSDILPLELQAAVNEIMTADCRTFNDLVVEGLKLLVQARRESISIPLLGEHASDELIFTDVPLTTSSAASLMGVSRPHLVKLLDSGIIDHYKVGRDRRVMLSTVKQYIESRRKETLSRLQK